LWEDVPKTDSRFSLSQSRSDSKFKGRLGHLIDAIADSHESILSHYSNEETCSGLETHSCIDCDRLFCSLDDFHEHVKDCKTELSTMHMTTPWLTWWWYKLYLTSNYITTSCDIFMWNVN
jgi:hypothetical protein